MTLRKADINRIARAAEHVRAAMVCMKNIKPQHLDDEGAVSRAAFYADLETLARDMENWVEKATRELEEENSKKTKIHVEKNKDTNLHELATN